MIKLIKEVNIFSYNNFWRVGGNVDVNFKCGGIVTIILFALMGAIAVIKFLEVIHMNVITFSSQNTISFTAPMISITNSSNNPNISQFMFALQFLTSLNSYQLSP
jgi:hypothetical protein